MIPLLFLYIVPTIDVGFVVAILRGRKWSMTLQEFEVEFSRLKDYKTKTIDTFNKKLIKDKVDVSFLKPSIADNEKYYRTYFQVSIKNLQNVDDKFRFIEDNFHLLHDWWHVDILPCFLENSMDFEYAYKKAVQYIESDLPYVRRFGYVLFIPRLVKDKENMDKLLALLKNDDVYHVVMGEAWLLSFIAMCDADQAYEYLKECDLKYNIVGKAIQKICDSFVVSEEDKERFKGLRAERKLIK